MLGTLEVLVDGNPVTLPPDARARELLGWLAVHPGRHPRSALAGRLRPDVSEDSARKTLRDAVYKLRTALGDAGTEALVATREEVGLAGARVDLHEFRRLRSAGEPAPALELAAGELLPGLDADWALRARDEHEQDVAETAAQLVRDAEEAGDLTAALRWARRRVELEPIGEAAHRDLVRLLALSDDRPAALRVASALSERLRRELGVPPSATTRALVDDIRAGRLGGAPPEGASVGQRSSVAEGERVRGALVPHDVGAHGPEVASVQPNGAAPTQPAPLPPPLARTTVPEGRAAALDRLEEAWARATDGQLTLAVVAGEAGIGKTTLAGALARRVHERGGPVLYGRSEEHALVPYQPWVELLEGRLSCMATDEADRWLTLHDGALTRLLPARARPGAREAGTSERYLAFEAVAALLAACAAGSPALVVLDDLHWADEESLTLLRHVVRAAESSPVLVVLCARDEELSAAAAETLAGLRRAAPPAEVKLDGLDARAVAAVAGRHRGDVTEELASDLCARTGGNPFFLDALLRDDADRGASAGPPPGVRDVMRRRLSQLDDAARGVLATAAVIGLEFEIVTLAGASASSVVTTSELLDAPLDAGLVEPAGTAGRYAFAHALVRETLLADLPDTRRARLHLQVASALEEAPGPIPHGEVARHLRAAGPLAPPERLSEAELRAAEDADRGAAPREAAEHYAAAVSSRPLSPEHAALLLALGHARDRAGDRDDARAAFASAAQLAGTHGDVETLARAALGFGGIGVMIKAADAQTVRLLESALAQVPRSKRALIARLKARLSTELYYVDLPRCRALSEEALDVARATGDPEALIAALNARRVALWDPAHSEARAPLVDEMIALAREIDDREAELQARNWQVVDLWELGRPDLLRSAIADYEALADAVGLPHYQWYVPLWRAGLAIARGEWAEAQRLQAAALELGRRADDANAPLLVHVQEHSIYALQRRYGDIDRDWVVRTIEESADPAAWMAWLAQIDSALGIGDRGQATATLLTADDCAALPMNVNWITSSELAEAVADLGDRDAAEALYRRLEPFADRFPVIARGVTTEHVVDHTLGRLAAVLGRYDEGVERLRRAIARSEAAEDPVRAAISTFHLARVHALCGDRDATEAAIADTVSRAEALSIPALAAEARAILDG